MHENQDRLNNHIREFRENPREIPSVHKDSDLTHISETTVGNITHMSESILSTLGNPQPVPEEPGMATLNRDSFQEQMSDISEENGVAPLNLESIPEQMSDITIEGEAVELDNFIHGIFGPRPVTFHPRISGNIPGTFHPEDYTELRDSSAVVVTDVIDEVGVSSISRTEKNRLVHHKKVCKYGILSFYFLETSFSIVEQETSESSE